MHDRLNEILEEIRELEKGIQDEIRRKEEEFQYKIRKGKVICFPAYGIPRVRRRDHIILDRHYLKYLNFIERTNCDYCSYFNGLASYISKVAARTEQYWCPIKHASGKARPHSRYHLFLDYGDAEGYRARLDALRRKFDDMQ